MKFLGNVNLLEKRFVIFAGINEHIVQYFMLLANQDDIVYEWDTNEGITLDNNSLDAPSHGSSWIASFDDKNHKISDNDVICVNQTSPSITHTHIATK
ncbi:MAG: hypothetical protein Q3971_09030 [Moraxella sp.]|nr:hypothetical protein [Moraxella sp.]